MTVHGTTPQGTVILCAPIVGSTTEDRVIVQLELGRWMIGRVLRTDRKKFVREASFNLADITNAATYAIEGSPEIATVLNKQAGKAMAAGCIVLLMHAGFISSDQPAEGAAQ